MNLPPDVPEGWIADDVSEYFQKAYENRIAAFATRNVGFRRLIEIDSFLRKCWENMLNPQPGICAVLLQRAHLQFLAGSEAACSGQLYPCMAIHRSAMEAAGYAAVFRQDKEAFEVWINRHENEESLKKARRTITTSKVKEALSQYEKSLETAYTKLYELSIDFGAHPNERGIHVNAQILEDENFKRVEQLLFVGDSPLLDFGIRFSAQCGVTIARVVHNIFEEHCLIEGLSPMLSKLKQGL